MKLKNRNISIPLWAAVLLIGAGSFSVLLNLSLLQKSGEKPLPPIQGTYCTGNPGMPNADHEYLALGKDGIFDRYRQFHVLARGSYTKDRDDFFTLRSNDGNMESGLIYAGEKIYLVDPDGTVTDYTKFSDTPTLINVK